MILSSARDFVDQDEVNAILSILESVLPAGVRVEYLTTFDSNEAFAMDGMLSGSGFGSLGDPAVGGQFAFIHQRNGFFSFDGNATGNNEGFGTIEDTLVGGQFVGT